MTFVEASQLTMQQQLASLREDYAATTPIIQRLIIFTDDFQERMRAF